MNSIVSFFHINTNIPEFKPSYKGYFVIDKNNNFYLGLDNRWEKIVFQSDLSIFKDSDDEEFLFSDKDGHVIATIGADGIKALNYNIVNTSGEILGSINDTNISDILSGKSSNDDSDSDSDIPVNTGNKYVLNGEDDGFYFSDLDGNVVAYIDADGIHSVGYFDEDGEEITKTESQQTTTATSTNRFTNKNVFSLCDSLGSGGHWQKVFCEEVGAKPFNRELNGADAELSAAGKTLSCGGAGTLHSVTWGWEGAMKGGLTSNQQRAINFVEMSAQTYGTKDYLFLENINDFNYFEYTDITEEVIADPGLMQPVFVEKTLLYTDRIFSNATEAKNYFYANMETVLAGFTPSVNRSVILKYGTAAFKFTVANAATTNGVLKITINGIDYDTEITAGTSVADILNDIFIYNFPGFENTSDDTSVTITAKTVETANYLVGTDIVISDTTGAGVTVVKSSTSGNWTSIFTSNDVNDWTDPTKWEHHVTSMRAIMGIIEYLEQKLPNTHLIYVLMPRFPTKYNLLQKADGTPDERAYKNQDIVKKFEWFLKMQKAVCEYYNLEYIDLAHTMGWNYTNMHKWFGEGTIHWNSTAHEYIGKFLANKLA